MYLLKKIIENIMFRYKYLKNLSDSIYFLFKKKI